VVLQNVAALRGSVTEDGLPSITLVITWTKVSGPGEVTFGNANAADTSATFGAAGTYVLRLKGDDTDKSTTDDVTVTVNNAGAPNEAPVVNAGADLTVVLPNSAALHGTVTDDGQPSDALVITWTKVSGPGNVTFGNAGAADTTATFDAAGTYVLRLKGDDSQKSTTDDVTVTVNNAGAPNEAPAVNAGADVTVTLPNGGALHGTVTDDGQPSNTLIITWTKVSVPVEVSFGNANASDTTASFTAAGTYVLRLKGDDTDKSSTDDVTVTVNDAGAPNEAPAVNAGPDVTVVLPNAASLHGSVTDDGQPSNTLIITWTKVSGPGEVSFGNANAADTTASFTAAGTYVLRLTGDDTNKSTTDEMTVTVNNAGAENRAPAVSAGADLTVVMPNLASLHGTVTDDGLPSNTLTVTWTQVSGPGNVSFGNANAADTTAGFSAAGVYVLRLKGDDGAEATTDDVTVTVNPAGSGNQKPNVNAGPDLTVILPNAAELHGTATDDGLPSNALTATWTQVSGPGTVAFGNSHAPDTIARFSSAGTYILRLGATDGDLSNTDDVTIVVKPSGTANDAPFVDAGPDLSVTQPAPAQLHGVALDDGVPFPLNILWMKLSGPGDVTFGDRHAADTNAAFSASGVYVLRLRADDGQYSAFDDVTVIVSGEGAGNKPPAASAGKDQTIVLPGDAQLVGQASDDGLPNPPGALTITWTQVSGPGAVTFANANAVATSASFSAAGRYVLRLSVTDTATPMVTDDIVINVLPVGADNQAPAVSAGPDLTVVLPAAAPLHGTVTDDGQPSNTLTIAWVKVSGPGSVTFGNAAAADTTADFTAAGTYVLRLSGSDGDKSTADDVTVTVKNAGAANEAPRVNAGPDQTVVLPDVGSLNGTVTDDGQPSNSLTITWTKVSGPGAVVFSNPASPQTTAEFGAAGVYVLRLEANDGSLTSSDDVSVEVKPLGSANAAPVVNAGRDLTVNLGNPAHLRGTATDDGLPNPRGFIIIDWTMVSGPGSVTFGNSAAADTTATFGAAGTYVLRLSADDGERVTPDEVTVTVNEAGAGNLGPAVDAGSAIYINKGAAASLRGTVDDDGLPFNTVTSAWTKVSGAGGVTFEHAENPETSATFSEPGVYVLRLSADDGELNSFADVIVTVNTPPVVSLDDTMDVDFGSPAEATGQATDDDISFSGVGMSYQWTMQSGPGTVTFGSPTALHTTMAFSQPGEYVLVLSASDGIGSGQDTMTVTVRQAGLAGGLNFKTYFDPGKESIYMAVAPAAAGAGVHIYTSLGQLVAERTVDATGVAEWNGRNRSGEEVADDVYLVNIDGFGTRKIAVLHR
jgi:hypothetical protein